MNNNSHSKNNEGPMMWWKKMVKITKNGFVLLFKSQNIKISKNKINNEKWTIISIKNMFPEHNKE